MIMVIIIMLMIMVMIIEIKVVIMVIMMVMITSTTLSSFETTSMGELFSEWMTSSAEAKAAVFLWGP